MSNALRVGADDGQRISGKRKEQMMSDLINGREMLKRYQEDLCYGIACKECSMCTKDGGCRVEEWIDNFPSADRLQDDEFKNFDRESLILLIEAQKERIGELLADRPQGEWIPSDTDGFVCSVCKNGYRNQPTLMGRPMFEYCPVCGARMKGADDDIH